MTSLGDLPEELYGKIACALVPKACDGPILLSAFHAMQCFSGINRASCAAAGENGLKALFEATGTDTPAQLKSLYDEERFRAHLRPYVTRELICEHEFPPSTATAVCEDAIDFIASTYNTRRSLAKACTYDINIYGIALCEWVVHHTFGPRFKLAEDLVAALAPGPREFTPRQWAVWGWETVNGPYHEGLPPVCRVLIDNAMGSSGPGPSIGKRKDDNTQE